MLAKIKKEKIYVESAAGQTPFRDFRECHLKEMPHSGTINNRMPPMMKGRADSGICRLCHGKNTCAVLPAKTGGCFAGFPRAERDS